MHTSRYNHLRPFTEPDLLSYPRRFGHDERNKKVPCLQGTVSSIPLCAKLQGRLNYAKLLLHKINAGGMSAQTIAALEQDYQQEFRQLRGQ